MQPTREQVAQALYDHDERKRNRLSPLPWTAETKSRKRPYLERADVIRTLYAGADAPGSQDGTSAVTG